MSPVNVTVVKYGSGGYRVVRLLIEILRVSCRKSGGMILEEFLRKRWHGVCGGVKRWLLTEGLPQPSTQ